jgi:hypothetical protein
MRKITAFFLVWMMILNVSGQVTINPSEPQNINMELLNVRQDETTIRYQFDAFGLKEVQINGTGGYHRLEMPGSAALLVAGAPEVLLKANSLIIPDDGMMEIEILSASYQDFANINLIPSKGNLFRDVNPGDVPYTWGVEYQQNRFYPGSIAQLRDPYILRDFRGQAVLFQPFQYNPVTKVLRVYHDVTLKVHKVVPGGINTYERTGGITKPVDEFYQIYQRHFANFGLLGINYTPVGEDGKMLIISHGNFMPEMADFVTWKNQRGIPTEMVDVSTIGTTASAIKTFVTNYYNTHGITYLLLVGDAAQIPTNSLASGHSDNAYAYILGNDSYPEFFVGRFSSENNAHVQTQVIRTLSYEMNPDTTGGWLKKSIGIASEEGPGHYNEMDYQHVRLMQADLLGFTYNVNLEYFEGSQGGNDAPGNPTATMIQTAVDAGAGIILYTGHGSNTSWGTSGFSNTNIGNLNNVTKWPFIWSVACVNGNFVNNTCFGEAWMRATKNDQPTGSVGILASTINQSWNPPMEAQDEMVDILVETYATNIKRTFGGLSMNGCMKMNDVYGNQGAPMTDTWTLFGDPSLLVYTSTPMPITATHQAVAFLGATQFPVFCPVNGAKATLSLNGQIIGTGIVSGSAVTINYTSPLAPDTMVLVITAFNRTPYIAYVPVIVSNAPFVVYNGHQVNDVATNNNSRADYGETFGLHLTLENIGVLTANNVSVVLRSLDIYVKVIDSTATTAVIANGAIQNISNAFNIELSDSVPNGHLAAMQLIITDNASNQWVSGFSLICFAPHLLIDTMYINDVAGGNGNGKLEPGEVGVIHAVVRNAGGAEAKLYECAISSNLPAAQLMGNQHLLLNTLPMQTPMNLQFYARLDTATPIGSSFRFDAEFSAGHYRASKSITDFVLSGDEDFETGNFQKFNWQQGGNSPWTITNSLPYEGTFCARSGVIGNNAQSTLSITWHAAYPDTISFWLKVSCENGSASGQKWDFLEFFIDGVSKAWWDGNKAWMRVAYLVTAGQHTFTWKYQKDAYATGGSDAAWIDLITFPAAGATVIPKPFMLMDFAHFSDVNGNNNQIINAGETIDISYKISNIGYLPTSNVNGQITVNDPLVSLLNPSASFGNFSSGASVLTANVMQVKMPVQATPGDLFTYNLTLTDAQALTWSYPFVMEVDAYTAIEKPEAREQIRLFPNPFREQLSFVVPEDHQGALTISVYSIDGRLLLQKLQGAPVFGELIILETGLLPSGALIVRVSQPGMVSTHKVIKQ